MTTIFRRCWFRRDGQIIMAGNRWVELHVQANGRNVWFSYRWIDRLWLVYFGRIDGHWSVSVIRP